ncbi:MAG: hypothetical protein JWQ27_1369 [Ferruginibacter sp.]|nr:hypothetical protein [Ferruginibacter sp.]
MKKLLFVSILMLSAFFTMAQSAKYNAAMTGNLAAIDSSFKNPANLLSLANNFERIATAEKSQWLPYYYAAYLQVMYGMMLEDKSGCDAIAEKATALISKADSLSPKNSEISAIKSMIATCHMLVNPMQRYMEYGMEASSLLEQAKTEDPNNPRPYFLIGQTLRYTPENFGGGCQSASEQLQIAMTKFKAFQPASALHPNWGMQRAQMLLDECKK